MSLTRLSFAATLLVTSMLAACSGSEDGPSTTTSSSKVALTGNLGSSGLAARSFGNLSEDGSWTITARELHVRGASGRTVDAIVAADGTFRLEVARGARWVVTVDDAKGGSAIVKFGDGESVVAVGADGDGATVDVGGIKVVGGEARSSVTIDGKFGLESTLASLDEVFEAANGALLAAQEALSEAQKAAEDALRLANEAEASAEEARRKAEALAAEAEAAAERAGQQAGEP